MACDVGLIGLAVMGQNLVLNMARHGIRVAVFNRTTETAQKFMAHRAAGLPIEHGETLADFVRVLKKPATVMIMVKTGPAVDDTIANLKPLLARGDLIADLGNSFFQDTERRSGELLQADIEYLGVGVSGGEKGALLGPSIMPGGTPEGYARLRLLFEAIAAKTDDGPCVTYIGPRGAGHFVKMVHNGLEYGDMQLIAEAYDVLRRLGGFEPDALAGIFAGYNRGVLGSYLMEITSRVLSEKDPGTGRPMVDVILDQAGQKGTGVWTSQTALELGEPVPTITAAVDARGLSAKKSMRVEAEKFFRGIGYVASTKISAGTLVQEVEDALYASKLSLYAQGLALLLSASKTYDYNLQIPELARIWKGGCIIRSGLLPVIRKAYAEKPDLPSLLLAPRAIEEMEKRYSGWIKVIQAALAAGIAAPALCASLAYFDSLRTARGPANLIQAQRDLFGAHTFERTDISGTFHHQWDKDDNTG